MSSEPTSQELQERIEELETEIKDVRAEAGAATEIDVEDTQGDSWSVSDLMESFNISRRTALQAIGLVAIGYTAPRAVLQSVSGRADAAATDNLTVPGNLSSGSVTTDKATLNDTATSPSTAGEFRLNGTDIEAYTGGGVKNLSNIGSGGSGAGDVATVTVASSGSSYSADYVCDGTNDHTTINNAIGSLPAGGGSVILTEGTYNLGGAVTDQGISNVKLQGQGWNTHLLLDGGVTDNVLETVGVDNWTVKDLRLDGNGANQSDGGDDMDQSGWYADNCNNLHLDSATVRNTIMSNVRWVATDGATYTDYRITDSWLHNTIGSSGSTASPDGYSITVRNGSTVERAICADSLITECSHQSIEWVGITKGTITGTIIYSTKPESASNGVMTGMNIHSTTAGTTSNIVITGNYVEVPNADATLIAASGPRMIITGNTAVGGNSAGFLLEDPQTSVQGGVVTGNMALNNNAGIGVGVSNATVSGNYVKNPTNHGIRVKSAASNCTVTGNVSDGAGDHGIIAEGADAIIGFNQVRNSTNASISDTGSGNTLAWNKTGDGTGEGPHGTVSGSVTLSSGSATVDTGISTGTTATFMLALGPGTSDADVAGDIRADSGTGTYVIDVEETDTSVGNPTVNYDVVRVR